MTINAIPDPNLATFKALLQAFLEEEDADRAKLYWNSFVSSGGTHSTGAGLTGTPDSMVAFPGGHYITESGSIVYPDDTANIWVICHKDLTTDPGGDWVREAGTHYLYDPVSGTQPTLPADTTLLMRVVTASGAITVATDLRTLTPLAQHTVSVFHHHISGEMADEDIVLEGILFPESITFLKADVYAIDPPTGSDLTFDILKDGAEQTNIITLQDSLVSGVAYGTTDITDISFSSAERFGLKIKSIGSTNPGGEINITLHYRKQ